MKQLYRHPDANKLSVIRPLCYGLGITFILSAFGCENDSRSNTGPAAKSFSNVSLKLSCPDSEFATAIRPAVKSWAFRTGADVVIDGGAMTPGDSFDLGVIPAPELGAWADRNELVTVPNSLRAPDHPFQWTGVLTAYREHIINWGGQANALPMAGDGYVVVYRADRLLDPNFIAVFRERTGNVPTAPTSWEEFAVLATQLAEFHKKPSLAPMTAEEVADLFFRVAACYDRKATSEVVVAQTAGQALSFQHDTMTAEPRLNAPSFRAAIDWLGLLAERKCFPAPRAASTDAAAALAGDASLAVLSLKQLAALPRENGAVPPRFGIAPLPGANMYYDPEKRQLVPAGLPNYVPYFSGGRVGVVRSRCANSQAAFDLLAELGGPTRSLEWLSTPGLGAGPFRAEQLERDRLSAWLGYGFDADRTRGLQEAMRYYLRSEVKNPAYGLRGPDQQALNAAAAAILGKVATGATPPDAAINELLQQWNAIDEPTKRETRILWRKLSAGVN